MATSQQPPGRIESVESLEVSATDAEKKPVSTEAVNEQAPVKEGNMSSSVSQDSGAPGLPVVAPEQPGTLNSVSDQNAIHSTNYAPHAQTFFYDGFENRAGEWEEYHPYLNVDGVEIGSAGIYNENPSLMYHTGYGYSQMPYGPFSPVTTLPPGDAQNYHPQHFPFSGGYYQPPPSPGITYLPSPTAVSQAGLSMSIDQNGSFLADTSSSNNMLFGPRPTYQASYGSFGRDWLKSPDGTGSMTPSPAASPQPVGTFMSFGQNTAHLASGVDLHQQRSMYSFGSTIGSYDRGYHGGFYHESTFGGSVPNFGVNGRGLIAVDKTKRRLKGNASLCSCNNTLDFLTEQNRGPRANKSKNPLIDQNSSIVKKNDRSTGGFDQKLYNSPDFVTEYKDAKFYIIKSYSEDNVHKSIKYGVWASTSNGNKKLDFAYRESREKEDPCPVFLFFSVNASAQFCGVAEMIGPVDFEKSVNYWQQDKWNGQFPVKWHIVKDVPNNLFRHIILENNDNKPVTNSRDTQEVKLEQGLEMLSIFKKHEYEDSILDDFAFYEEREKAMQERKAHQHHQHHQQSSNSIGVVSAAPDEKRNIVAVSGDFVDQLSKSFADAVRMEERNSGDPTSVKSIMGADLKAEDHRKLSVANLGKSS